jgi:hypothetical protein
LGIKQLIGDKLLRRESEAKKKKRNPTVPFANATLIGILYNAGDSLQKQHAKQLIDGLKTRKKEVVSLGYVDAKEFPAGIHDTYGYEYFNRKHLNWLGFPNHANVLNFIKQDFDYLINIDDNHPLHFLHLLSVSKTGCRVGPYSEKYAAFYDLMISAKKEDFVAELLHYLQKIG